MGYVYYEGLVVDSSLNNPPFRLRRLLPRPLSLFAPPLHVTPQHSVPKVRIAFIAIISSYLFANIVSLEGAGLKVWFERRAPKCWSSSRSETAFSLLTFLQAHPLPLLSSLWGTIPFPTFAHWNRSQIVNSNFWPSIVFVSFHNRPPWRLENFSSNLVLPI